MHRRLTAAGLATPLLAVAALAADRQTEASGAMAQPPLAGEAVIHPVESNLAPKPWTTTTASSAGSAASAATDDDPETAWIPAGTDGEWLAVDLGGTYRNLRKVELLFTGPGAGRYRIDASPDGERWAPLVEEAQSTGRGAMHLFTRPGTRAIRITLLDPPTDEPIGIAELRVFNYLRDDLVLGADLSFVDDSREREFWVHPEPERRASSAGPHLFDVVQDRGMSFVRLRVFNEPRNERTGEVRDPPRQGPERTIQSAREVREHGMGLGIDFHYADSWADPGKQPKPRAWAELEFDALVEALRTFTGDYLRRLVDQGLTPDKVAIGNEIINGFMWGSESEYAIPLDPDSPVNPQYFRDQAEIYRSQPGGRILWAFWNSDDPEERRLYDESWDRFATLVAAGIEAARAATPTSKIELHTIVGLGADGSPGLEKTIEFWDRLLAGLEARGQRPDVLAISYYPEWHGTVEQLDINLHAIATRYPGFEINIAETAYPASGETPQPNAIFPRSVQGQADAIQRVFKAANDVIDDRGVGVLLWEPASYQAMFRAVEGMENTFEPLASIDVFNRSHAREIVQDRVYASEGLPPTVTVMDAASGNVREVAVQWDQTPVVDPAYPGAAVHHGTAGSVEVRAVVDGAAM